ncbi:helix-turn-helix domain-containing protein [Emticicia sp. CRIBPO]|uniref:helix-turn-helix domain-containing protein n=1 Tax=Emticicia sp. CRIBPO TaxID=2683258 RepID=UPI001412C356|nr:helix-turn-helix transcriptional regulator [Emticicia sp. CRIBPO]NBA86607.1 helix-turn-helix domain-containing protein [Emticicia sp. CRIBPO]
MNFNNDNLRRLRIQASFSQEYMAEMLNMEHSSYNRLENGKQKLKVEEIPKIARALSITYEEVLRELTGWPLNNVNPFNQNSVSNKLDKDFLILLLNEKDNLIKEKSKMVELLEEKIEMLEKQNEVE